MASSIPTVASYLARITSEHALKPKFNALVAALIRPLIDAQGSLRSLLSVFDLDTAIGVQLDAVGQWVGRSRFVEQPLPGVYFAFDEAGVGFDQGVWKGPFDPIEGLTRLDDDMYRQLLRAKVALNNWDGSLAAAEKAVNLIVNNPSSIVAIYDNQDMTETVAIAGDVPNSIAVSLLQGGYLPVTPAGVGVNYAITSVNGAALFGFDVDVPAIAGFDKGAWAGTLGAGPGAVLGFAVVEVTETSVKLSWIAPASGLGPYTYQVQYVPGDGTKGIWQAYGVPTGNTVATVSGLQPATQYAFEVYAIGPAGPGPASQPLVVTTSAPVATALNVVALGTLEPLSAVGGATFSGLPFASLTAAVTQMSAVASATVSPAPFASATISVMALSALGSHTGNVTLVSGLIALAPLSVSTATATVAPAPVATATASLAALSVLGKISNGAAARAVLGPLAAVGAMSQAVAPTVIVNPISGASHTATFTVSGRLQGFSFAPTLQYVDDPVMPAVSGITEPAITATSISIQWSADTAITESNLPSGASVSQTAFSFTHPALAAGSHTIYVVANGSVVGSAQFTVS